MRPAINMAAPYAATRRLLPPLFQFQTPLPHSFGSRLSVCAGLRSCWNNSNSRCVDWHNLSYECVTNQR